MKHNDGIDAAAAGEPRGEGAPGREAVAPALIERLDRIEAKLGLLLDRETAKEWYSTDEFARLVGRAEFTVREWARLDRVKAAKKRTGRGMHASWAISHEELERYRREGLLPQRR